MEKSSTVHLHAHIFVDPQDWHMFELQIGNVKQIVRQEGAAVLAHQCYKQSGTNECLIIEAYKDESAFLSHLELVRPVAKKYPAKIKYLHIHLLGDFSTETVTLLKAVDPACDVRHFKDRVSG